MNINHVLKHICESTLKAWTNSCSCQGIWLSEVSYSRYIWTFGWRSQARENFCDPRPCFDF